MKMNAVVRIAVAAAMVPMMLVQQSFAWGADGHRMINRLAAQTLPKDVPEFLRSAAAQDAMSYYGPQPDHWRANGPSDFTSAMAPEHFMDMEYADMVGPELPRKRYDFIRALAYAQKAHPEVPLTPEKVGLQPYAMTETYAMLTAAMRDYREAAAAHQETKPIEAEVVFLAGELGHWVADGSQPLHATYKYNGWVGDNPNNYTTLHTIHSQFETAFVKANVNPARDLAPLVPAKAEVIADVFTQYVAYLHTTNGKVEKLYQLEKAGGFTDAGSAESRAFTYQCMAAGATELRDLIYTAWVKSGDPLPAYRNANEKKLADDK